MEKDLDLTPSHEHTKITTNCWETIDKKYWDLQRMIFYIQIHKEETTMT